MKKHLIEAKITHFRPLNVKIQLKSKVFCGNVWWVQKIVVLLHSLLRNALSLSN